MEYFPFGTVRNKHLFSRNIIKLEHYARLRLSAVLKKLQCIVNLSWFVFISQLISLHEINRSGDELCTSFYNVAIIIRRHG